MWTQFGRANLILDNLIAEKKVAPMVVVMPFAYAYPWHAGVAGDKQRADFEKDLTEDLIPFVQANYRVSTDREHRALAGLSMGGGLTLAIGPRHLDLFSRLAVFSSGAGQNPEQSLAAIGKNAKAINDKVRLFWIGVGTEDGAMAGAKRASDYLNSVGVKHIYKTSPGAHTWIVWRKYLNEVAPQIFPARNVSSKEGGSCTPRPALTANLPTHFDHIDDAVVRSLLLRDPLGRGLLRGRRHMALQRHRLGVAVGVDIDRAGVEIVGINQRSLDLHRLCSGVQRGANGACRFLGFLRDAIARTLSRGAGLARFLLDPRSRLAGFLLHFSIRFASFLLGLGGIPFGVFFHSSCSVLTGGKQRRGQQCRW